MKKGLIVCLLTLLLLFAGCQKKEDPAATNTTNSVEVLIPTSGENERQYLAELMQEWDGAEIERQRYDSYDQLFKENLEVREDKRFKVGTNLELIGSHADDTDSKVWYGYFVANE
ncbi:hypothetical protein [Enterococcus sp. AZ109]|uniref:hypothetical protein n=1 Tax=Enterococcus sp. AZ109 TaxID=2774634 RepID=UPI003F27E1D9